MDILDITILGLLQGLTEFLPISSSGHLVVARTVFGISDSGGMAVDAFLHLGTLAAVLLYYRHTWSGMVRALLARDEEAASKRNLAAKLAVATVPGAVAGYLFQESIEMFLRDPRTVAIGFLVTALWLWLGDRRDYTEESARQATFHDAAIIGLWQVLALVPGISRSGTTIAAGRWQGLSRSRATHFSFLLSGPIIAGAGFSSLGRLVADSSAYPPLLLAVGFMAALASGLMAIAGVLRFIERTSFWSFSVYLVIVAAALLAVSYVPGLSEAR